MFRNIFVCALIAAVCTACDDGPSGPSGPEAPLDLAGTWNYTEAISNSALSVSCQGEGTLTIEQTGSTFTGSSDRGTLVCTGGVTIPDEVSGPITGAQIEGREVSFVAGACSYEGKLQGDPPNLASGEQSCDIPLDGQTYTFTGTWQASR